MIFGMWNNAKLKLIALSTATALAGAGLALAGSGEPANAAALPNLAAPVGVWDANFNPNDRESARAAWKNVFKNTANVQIGWTGSVNGCKAGTFSA
ncbi:MAG: hypothetical protein FWG16_08565, partial [Micrococcales bacterium]|nr:hypothetical protein [Micrococcales bacterium]